MAAHDRANILIVDDLPDKRLVLESILETLNEHIVTARSGEEALQRVLEQDFAVILLDVNMPGMDGYEAASFIRKRKKSAHTPIIFVTAYADQVQTVEGYNLGAVDYIFSPVVPEILRSKVKVFVNLYRMTQQVRQQAEERIALMREQTARAAAEDANRRSNFLAEVSTVLSSSLDVETTQRGLARLVVPFIADLSLVTLADERNAPGRTELAWAGDAGDVRTMTIVDPSSLPPVLHADMSRVLTAGKMTNVANPVAWQEFPSNSERGASPLWSLDLRLRSVLVVPLRARGRILGTLALGNSDHNRSAADFSTALDIASRAAVALDNANLYQNIQETDRRKNQFLVMLAHELRNPLAPIRNAVQVLQLVNKGKAEPLLLESCEMIGRQVTHMAHLIDDLLDMSRLAYGKILLRKQLLDLVDVVRHAGEDYQSTFAKAGLRLETNFPDQALFVNGDPTRLAQIVGNILHNANKFTDAGGRVTLEVAEETLDIPAPAPSNTDPEQEETSAPHAIPTPFVRITIRDTGIGMDAAMIARVFETFSQADTSLDRNRGGLGLGLSLVKGLVDLHGGQVQVKSEGVGKGTEVTVHLPIAREAAPSPTPQTQPNGQRTSRRLLIIEDNRDAAESMRLLLALTGHQVAVAEAGSQGVEMARQFHPQVVLCDIGLPGEMDGFAVAKAVRGDPQLANMYLIALTGYGQEQDQRRTREAGFNAHLTKPVEFSDLERLIDSLPVQSAMQTATNGQQS